VIFTCIPAIAAPSPSTPLTLTANAALAKTRLQIPSPIGQPSFSLRLGAAESDKLSYFGGLSYEVPISLGIHLLSFRADGDIWEHFSGRSGGGTALSANVIVGPNSAYYGAGIAYSARVSHASGPSGPGIKLIAGSQPIPILGYEFDAIVADRGVMGAAMITFHF
jgi:hypothetical protein